MALINCPECGKEISDKSEICVGCGFPLRDYVIEKEKNDEPYTICTVCGKKILSAYSSVKAVVINIQ